MPLDYWQSIASSANGHVLVAAAGGWTMLGPIYVSTDAGINWTLTSAPTNRWVSVAASANGGLLVAAAGGTFWSEGIYLSTDFGATWSISGAPVTNWSAIACSADGTRLVAVSGGICNYGPIYTSVDSGVTWNVTAAPVTNWTSVASSADGTMLAASCQGRIYVSTNSGITWNHTQPPYGSGWQVVVTADGQRLLALPNLSTYGNVCVSSNAGASWLVIDVPHFPDSFESIAASSDGTRLVAVVKGYTVETSGFFHSMDAGATWITNRWPGFFSFDGWLPCVASSADGNRLAATLGRLGIYLWHSPSPSAPDAFTQPAVGTNGDLGLHGMVNPNSRETWAWFEWDTSPAFGNGTGPVRVGSGWKDVSLSAALSGLPPGVACYSRIVAANDFGLSLGLPVIYQAPRLTLLGDNPLYLLGSDPYEEPGAQVQALPIAIAAGEFNSLALKADRTVVGWGGWGQEPAVPPGISNVVEISTYIHDLVLKADGTVVAWGDNTFGETNVPTDLSCAVAVAAGWGFSLALKPDGTVVGWGLGATGVAGHDGVNFGQALIPEGLSNVVAISAGYANSLALKSDGTIVGWGYPYFGGTNPPTGLSNVVAISAGEAFGLALKSDGTVAGWGHNGYGEVSLPRGLSNVVAIAAGFSHSLALKADGTVVGWGDDSWQQASPPAGLSNVIVIAAGRYHSLALKADGTIVGWGSNTSGETDVQTNLVDSSGAAEMTGAGSGGYGYTPGTYLRTYTAINPRGGVAQATRIVVLMGTLEVGQRVLGEMMALKTEPAGHHSKLNLAMAELKHALATNSWVGDLYFSERGGRNFFAEDAMVVHLLDRLLKQKDNVISATVVQGWEENLAKAARLLAVRAVQNGGTTPGGGHPVPLPPFFTDQMDAGDQAAAAHQYVNAILHYKNAWKLIFSASPPAPLPSQNPRPPFN